MCCCRRDHDDGGVVDGFQDSYGCLHENDMKITPNRENCQTHNMTTANDTQDTNITHKWKTHDNYTEDDTATTYIRIYIMTTCT